MLVVCSGSENVLKTVYKYAFTLPRVKCSMVSPGVRFFIPVKCVHGEIK